MQHADPVSFHRFDNRLRDSLASRHEQAESGAFEHPPEQLPHRYVEAIRRFLQNHIPVIDGIRALHPMEAVDHRAMFDHYSFGFSRRTGRVDDVGEIARLVDQVGVVRGTVVNFRLLQIDDRHPRRRLWRRRAVDQHDADAGVRQNVADPIRRIIR